MVLFRHAGSTSSIYSGWLNRNSVSLGGQNLIEVNRKSSVRFLVISVQNILLKLLVLQLTQLNFQLSILLKENHS